MNLDELSELTGVAVERKAWLRPLESRVQLARKRAPWHLWLDKYSMAWAQRCDAASDHWSEQAESARRRGERDRAKELKRKAEYIPSGKTAALLVSIALARSSELLAEDCRRKQAWLGRIEAQVGQARFRRVALVNESALLLHLGRPSALENVGLFCDRSTGLLIIPGTAAKGVLSAWACWAANESKLYAENLQLDETRRDLARRILGDNSGQKGQATSGEVIVLGGFPTAPPVVGLDIVNPHHDAQGRNKEKLTPNAFLSVEPGTIWQFCFMVRAGLSEPKRLLDQTETWLREALTQVGIGAKTAAGYGRFREPSLADLAREEQQRNDAAAAALKTADEAKKQADRTTQQKKVQAAMKSDYPTNAHYKNRVLDKLNPGAVNQLETEVAVLRKEENKARLEELKKLLSSKDYKDVRKRLREKSWFPQGWLPPQT
ncbi:MAG: type III-B CRISPR module RAMP protein Cmr6 [Verrucomicrobiales bacterium]|nr:type III-B CRISPR module RAMP protein Cmr6 [Verrucomicrobiales bacterium]